MGPTRNEKIGYVLKLYRKASGFSVQEVSRILWQHYKIDAAEKTIYGWESNQAHPTADTFVVLCQLYQITDLTSMYPVEDTAPLILTEEEKQMIYAFRKAIPYQDAIRCLLRAYMPRRRQVRKQNLL